MNKWPFCDSQHAKNDEFIANEVAEVDFSLGCDTNYGFSVFLCRKRTKECGVQSLVAINQGFFRDFASQRNDRLRSVDMICDMEGDFGTEKGPPGEEVLLGLLPCKYI